MSVGDFQVLCIHRRCLLSVFQRVDKRKLLFCEDATLLIGDATRINAQMESKSLFVSPTVGQACPIVISSLQVTFTVPLVCRHGPKSTKPRVTSLALCPRMVCIFLSKTFRAKTFALLLPNFHQDSATNDGAATRFAVFRFSVGVCRESVFRKPCTGMRVVRNEECLVNATHYLALITSLPLVLQIECARYADG